MNNGVKKNHGGARAAALRRLREERLGMYAPDASVENALECAKLRLDTILEPPDLRATAEVRAISWTALARLTVGDFDAAAADLQALAHCPVDRANVGDAALYLLVAARYYAWTAHLPLLLEQWPHVRRAAELCQHGRPSSSSLPDEAIRAAALRELAIAAESIGETADASALSTAAKQASDGVARLGREGPASDDPLVALLEVAGAGDGGRWPTCCPWASWAEFARGRSEAGYLRWRSCFAMPEADAGCSIEMEPDAFLDRRIGRNANDGVARSALAAATLVHGLLGARPDAARHRLRLRPQIPAAWDHLEVQQLAMGDALFTMNYRRTGSRHEYVVEQTAGAVPCRLILEPALALRGLSMVTVDGTAAQLDVRPFGERLLAPVQLILDETHTLVLE